jgi:thiamine kinase-like enzyme
MPQTDENLLETAISSIPFLANRKHEITRLGGLTNKVYKVGVYCLRLPGEGTQEYINRAHEAVAAEKAAHAGVSPELLYVDPESGVMVTRFIDGAVTMTPELFNQTSGAPARAAKAFASLHQSGAVFPYRFELFTMIEDYLAILSTKDVALPKGYHDVVKSAGKIKQVLAVHPVDLAPCHCDPLCENFLDTGERMWIVDWEYSGMNDPMWDLGDLSVEAGFNSAQDNEMMLAYFGRPPHPNEHGRIVIYKAMCDLLWTLWGLIQLANNNTADDFRAYADGRFARCNALMATPSFGDHVDAVAKI